MRWISLAVACMCLAAPACATLQFTFQTGTPGPYSDAAALSATIVGDAAVASYSMLDGVPTSRWTYGCSATAAGMMFGYYDRHGYADMYTGPANGGVAPLYDLGANCSLIATKMGFDGRVTRGHVDDYWRGYGEGGADPWQSYGREHTWGDCVADFLGTNQFKWDYSGDGRIESNVDGATTLWFYKSGQRLYDYVPPSAGGPRTSLTHGLKLFAESRGYDVLFNYTQRLDTLYAGGFSFDDFMLEIDSGRPVLMQLTGHTMLGVGYDDQTDSVLFHDTWDNNVHQMAWGGSYAEMNFHAVTVLGLETIQLPEPQFVALLTFGAVPVVAWRKR